MNIQGFDCNLTLFHYHLILSEFSFSGTKIGTKNHLGTSYEIY